MIWRVLTLLLAAGCISATWPWLRALLDWPSQAPQAGVFIALLLAAGCARLIELVFDTALRQGWIQSLSALRNLLRIAAVLVCNATDAVLTAEWVIGLEASVAGLFTLAGSVRLWHMTAEKPIAAADETRLPKRLRAFAAQGYASLVLAQFCGMDAIKLVLSHTAGPAVLAVFGLAQSLAETVARYMPAVLLCTGDILLPRLAPALAWPELMGATLALLVLLHAQALRLMASLIAQVRSDNRPILWANLATLPVPWATAAMTATWGLAGAVAGAGLLELIYAAVTLRTAGLSASALWGPRRFWVCVACALVAATLALGGLRWVSADARLLLAGVPLCVAIYGWLVWRLQALSAAEVQSLRGLQRPAWMPQ